MWLHYVFHLVTLTSYLLWNESYTHTSKPVGFFIPGEWISPMIVLNAGPRTHNYYTQIVGYNVQHTCLSISPGRLLQPYFLLKDIRKLTARYKVTYSISGFKTSNNRPTINYNSCSHTNFPLKVECIVVKFSGKFLDGYNLRMAWFINLLIASSGSKSHSREGLYLISFR